MPLFSYKASNKEGKIIEEVVQATNKKEAAAFLESEELKVLTLKEIKEKSILMSGVSVSEKAAFCRFMATMLKAGLPMPEAIDIIREESQNKKMKNILFDVAFNIRKGENLSTVLAKYKDTFDSVFLTMIKAGEESGTLEKSFEYLGKELMASYELNQKIKGALMYPLVIVAAMIANAIIMLTFVLPKLSDVFLSLNVELPTVSKFVLGFGKTVGENMAITLGSFFALLFIFVMLFVIKRTRTLIFAAFVKLPVVSKVMEQIDVARFSRTLSTLLRSGVPIMVALDVSSDVLRQPKLRSKAGEFSAGVAKGESLSDVLTAHKELFPGTLVQTIKAGEKTGSLEIVLEELASFYELEVDYGLKRATSLLEPLLMLIIGVAVGAMVVILITPIYSILGGLEGGA